LRIKPTIVIGHGAFGLAVLRRFLRKTAPRGSLIPAGLAAADDDVRRLRDIALLWMPEPSVSVSASSAAELQSADDPYGRADFLRDLYRQIDTVPNMPGAAETVLCDKVADAARFLRSPELVEARAGLDGLDVIVVAQARKAADITALDSLNRALLSRLMQNYREWCEGQRAARKLHCIAIYDFDNYRGGSDDDRRLRRAVQASMEGWQRALEHPGRVPRPILDRCYLLDGRAGEAHRGPHLRLDELVLFLELLLFEGLRAEKQELYQQRSLGEPITATFGIRLLEESTMVLSRNAAATFGQRWLDTLIGDQERCPDRQARQVEETLSPYRRQAIEQLIEDGRLTDLFDARAGQMLPARLGLLDDAIADVRPVEAGDELRRPAQLQARDDLVAGRRVGGRRQCDARDLGPALVQAVELDVLDERAPVALTLVRAAVDGLREELSAGAGEAPASPPDAGDPAERLERLHRRYLDWREELHLLTATSDAVLDNLLALLPPAAQPWLKGLPLAVLGPRNAETAPALLDGLQRVDEPIYWTLIWAAVLWPCLALLVQPLIMAVRLRPAHVGCPRSPSAHRPIDTRPPALGQHELPDLALPRAEEARRGVQVVFPHAIEDIVVARAREMDWLRKQLKAFLQQSIQPETPVRNWVRREGAFEALLETNPPIRERLCSQQRDLPRPFAGWSEHFCDAFLDPLRFIDDLSKQYVDAHERDEERRSGREDLPQRREELIAFIEASNLGLACRFVKDDGVTDAQRWCVTAQRWKNVNGMTLELDNRLRIKTDDIIPAADPSRVYLVLLQSGIAAANLERQP